MAITKIERINNLDGYLIYASNPHKTFDGNLIFENRCNLQFAALEFDEIIVEKKSKSGKHFNESPWVIIQAFKPFEIDPKDAHELGCEFAKNYLGEGHQFIVLTHVDGDHIHNHIVFNHVNMDTLKCFDSKTENIIKKMRKKSDELCEKNNLSVIKNPKRSGVSQKEFYARKQNRSFKARIEKMMDAAIEKSDNFEEFLEVLKSENSIEINTDKIMKFRLPDQERFTRITKLHADYSEENLKFRIENKELVSSIKKETKNDKRGISVLAINKLYKDIQIIENEIELLQKNIEHIEAYRNSWQLINDFKKSENKDEFKRQYFVEFKAYDDAKKAISALRESDGKLPKVDIFKTQIEALLEKKKPLEKALNLAKESLPNLKNVNANINKNKFKNYSDRYDIFYNSDDPMESITALLRQGTLMRRYNIDTEEYKELEKAGKAHLDELENKSRSLQREITSLEKFVEQEPIYRAGYELIKEYKSAENKKEFKQQNFEKFKAYDIAKRTVFKFKDEDGELPKLYRIEDKIKKLKAERSEINSTCKDFRENLKSTGFVGIGLKQR